MTQPFGCQSVDGIVLALVANGWTKTANFPNAHLPDDGVIRSTFQRLKAARSSI